ncbi:MAG TPA: hypothetical protein VGF24_28515 [Vicinamibacterales bacterium]|jgi:hypothetical protein
MGLMRLPVIATVAELDRARHGDHVLLEARISPSNAFTVLETWIREDHKYVVHTGNFAAYWKRRARPVSNGVTDEVQEVQSVPAGLRVQVEQADVAIENDDFIPGFEGGSEGISGGDAPPPVDLVRGFEIGEFVTVQGRLHNNGRRWAIEAERVDEATAAHYVASLKSDASESERLSRAFSGVLIALALVVGVPSVIGGVYCLRRFSMNPPATSLARD